MEQNQDISTICVAAFSRIAASISHEIKNTLSIINENAGLLDDLAAMSGEDGSIPADRVKTATTSIIRQVARSNLIMKNLNRFAHSGDVPIGRIDVAETLALAVALAGRQAAMRQVTLNASCPSNLGLQTYPQVLLTLLYSLLCHAAQRVPGNSELVFLAKPTGEQVSISLATNPPSTPPISAPDSQERVLLDYLRAKLDIESTALVITVPKALLEEE